MSTPYSDHHRLSLRVGFVGIVLATTLACTATPTPSSPEHVDFWASTTFNFTNDLIAYYNTSLPAVHITGQTVPGSVVVASEVQRAGGLGFAQADVVYLAYRYGIEDRAPQSDLRGMAVLWMNNVYVVVRNDSPLHDIASLKGKRVGILVRGTSGEFVTRIVLKAYELSYQDLQPTFESTAAMMEHLKRGELDAAITSYPFPSPFVETLNRQIGVRLLPVEQRISNRLAAAYPFLRRVTIQPSDFFVHKRDVETVAAEVLLICRKDLSEEAAYELTKAFFVALPGMARKYPEAALIDPEQAPTTPIPLHPGAARYYREREILE
jgi:TRAP transporter TAXI family solute receptor